MPVLTETEIETEAEEIERNMIALCGGSEVSICKGYGCRCGKPRDFDRELCDDCSKCRATDIWFASNDSEVGK